MQFPSRGTVDRLKKAYPPKTRVALVQMDDIHAPPPDTQGTVMFVDDAGTVHVAWDNGSTLGAIYGADVIRII